MADVSYIAGGLLAGAGKGLVDMSLETLRQQKAETLQRMQIEAADRRSDRQMAHQTNLKGLELAAQEPERKARVGLLRAQSGYYDERARGGGSGTTKGMVVVDKRDGTVYGADYEPPPGEEGHYALVPSSTANAVTAAKSREKIVADKQAAKEKDTVSAVLNAGKLDGVVDSLIKKEVGFFEHNDAVDIPWAGGDRNKAKTELARHIRSTMPEDATKAEMIEIGKAFLAEKKGARPAAPAASPATRQAGKPPGDANAEGPGGRGQKPGGYPDARWSDRAGGWVVQRDGKWFKVE